VDGRVDDDAGEIIESSAVTAFDPAGPFDDSRG
jgi:hypothetical protein